MAGYNISQSASFEWHHGGTVTHEVRTARDCWPPSTASLKTCPRRRSQSLDGRWCRSGSMRVQCASAWFSRSSLSQRVGCQTWRQRTSGRWWVGSAFRWGSASTWRMPPSPQMSVDVRCCWVYVRRRPQVDCSDSALQRWHDRTRQSPRRMEPSRRGQWLLRWRSPFGSSQNSLWPLFREGTCCFPPEAELSQSAAWSTSSSGRTFPVLDGVRSGQQGPADPEVDGDGLGPVWCRPCWWCDPEDWFIGLTWCSCHGGRPGCTSLLLAGTTPGSDRSPPVTSHTQWCCPGRRRSPWGSHSGWCRRWCAESRLHCEYTNFLQGGMVPLNPRYTHWHYLLDCNVW